jgi:deoxyribonuclease (pyrimidine dimer)
MTRINLISPEHLTARHLIAEYKEITHVTQSLYKRLDKTCASDLVLEIPLEYTLGAGHVKFFYNKVKYLYNRFILLYAECKSRAIKIDFEFYTQRSRLILDSGPYAFFNDYCPTVDAYNLVIERITQSINERPYLYPDKDLFFDNIHKYIQCN